MDNSTAIGVTNLIFVLQITKSMDLILWWLCAKNLNNSSVNTGIEAAIIGQTTTPNTTHPSTVRPKDPSMPVQKAYYLELLPNSGFAAFSY
jgi:hypothetical protein